MRVAVNRVPFSEDRMTNMAWSFGELISYASRGTCVRPGDNVGSGTTGVLPEIVASEATSRFDRHHEPRIPRTQRPLFDGGLRSPHFYAE